MQPFRLVNSTRIIRTRIWSSLGTSILLVKSRNDKNKSEKHIALRFVIAFPSCINSSGYKKMKSVNRIYWNKKDNSWVLIIQELSILSNVNKFRNQTDNKPKVDVPPLKYKHRYFSSFSANLCQTWQVYRHWIVKLSCEVSKRFVEK